jgi:hypothetical protein
MQAVYDAQSEVQTELERIFELESMFDGINHEFKLSRRYLQRSDHMIKNLASRAERALEFISMPSLQYFVTS